MRWRMVSRAVIWAWVVAGAWGVSHVEALGEGSPLADIGPAPEVVLTDTQGESFDLAKLKGKVVLVSFMFTTCNGVCPATTHNLYRIQQKLEADGLWGKQVEFVSITLDPANDRPEVLRRYAEIYGCDLENWHFLTGSEGEVARVVEAWDMWARRDERTGLLDHPSRIFLLDLRGHRREIYNLQYLQAAAVLEDVRGLLVEGAAGRGEP